MLPVSLGVDEVDLMLMQRSILSQEMHDCALGFAVDELTITSMEPHVTLAFIAVGELTTMSFEMHVSLALLLSVN